jgi:hypothetical protein
LNCARFQFRIALVVALVDVVAAFVIVPTTIAPRTNAEPMSATG